MDLTDYKKITLPELQEIFIVRLKEVIEFFEKIILNILLFMEQL